MTRTNSVLSPLEILADAWIDVPSGSVIVIDASLGRRFRIGTLAENATVEITNSESGRKIELRFEQDATGGRTVTFNGITTIGSSPVSTVASAVSFVDLVQHDERGWEAFGVAGGASGTMTSLTMPTPEFDVADPTGAAVVTWDTQTANKVLASATSGGAAAPAFRALVLADLPANMGRLIAITVYTTGSGNHTMNTLTTKHVVWLQGGGGGGGGASSAASSSAAGGGGCGGAFAMHYFTNTTGGGAYAYAVGAGGTGGTSAGGPGATGGDTTIAISPGGSTVSGYGGKPGAGMAATTTFPAVAKGGDLGPGSGSPSGTFIWGRDGSSGGVGLVLGLLVSFGGHGGSSFMGAGSKEHHSSDGVNGNSPYNSNPGGGGSGGSVTDGSTASSGGAGHKGFIIIYEYA